MPWAARRQILLQKALVGSSQGAIRDSTPSCRPPAPKHCRGPPEFRTPGLLLLEIDTEEVGLRRTALIDEVARRHARRYFVLIDQTRTGNPREIRLTAEPV